MMSEFWIHS